MIIVCIELPLTVVFVINAKEDMVMVNSLILEEVLSRDKRTIGEIFEEVRSQGIGGRYYKELSYKLVDLPRVVGE